MNLPFQHQIVYLIVFKRTFIKKGLIHENKKTMNLFYDQNRFIYKLLDTYLIMAKNHCHQHHFIQIIVLPKSFYYPILMAPLHSFVVNFWNKIHIHQIDKDKTHKHLSNSSNVLLLHKNHIVDHLRPHLLAWFFEVYDQMDILISKMEVFCIYRSRNLFYLKSCMSDTSSCKTIAHHNHYMVDARSI